jgi:hypothetical protein
MPDADIRLFVPLINTLGGKNIPYRNRRLDIDSDSVDRNSERVTGSSVIHPLGPRAGETPGPRRRSLAKRASERGTGLATHAARCGQFTGRTPCHFW